MKKEEYEWIQSWCDLNWNNDLPRVLLVGDSITWGGYQQAVRDSLHGIAYVDYVATSYAVDNPLYCDLITQFYNNSHYDVVHFNHGLHGEHLSQGKYHELIFQLLKTLQIPSLILATSTCVMTENNQMPCPKWTPLVNERNLSLMQLAKEFGAVTDDLFSVSKTIPVEFRKVDGVHYTEDGFKILAQSVTKSIKFVLSQESK